MFIQCSFVTDVDNGFNNETHTTAEYIKYIFHIKNDISPRRYDIQLAPYDIFSCEKYDIISVPSYTAGVYHPPQVDIIPKVYHPFRQERISLKKALLTKCFFHGADDQYNFSENTDK